MANWHARDPAGAGRWVISLPPGPRRDHAAKELADRSIFESPAASAAWAELIGDPKLQQSTAAEVYPEYSRENPARAVEWINRLEAVGEAWKGRFLRSYQ